MLNFRSLFFPAHVRAQVHVCQALTVTWLCLPPLFSFSGAVFPCACASRPARSPTPLSARALEISAQFLSFSWPCLAVSSRPLPESRLCFVRPRCVRFPRSGSSFSVPLAPPSGCLCLCSLPPGIRPHPSLRSVSALLASTTCLPSSLGSAFSLQFSPFYSCLLPPLLLMASALSGYISSDEEAAPRGPLGEVISGNDITLPPDQVFSGGPLDCLYCYASSGEETEQPLLHSASAAPSLVGVSDPEADTEVHRLINEQRLQDAAREALELAVMGREDPRELAIQAIHAASSPRAELGTTIKARPQIKARPKIRTWPPLPRIPHPNAARVFPKPSTQGYTYISGPTPASWGTDRTRTRSTRGPAADQVTQHRAASSGMVVH